MFLSHLKSTNENIYSIKGEKRGAMGEAFRANWFKKCTGLKKRRHRPRNQYVR